MTILKYLMIMKKYYCAIVFMLIMAAGYGQDYTRYGIDTTGPIPKGLKVGDKAPDFTAYDQTGKQVTMKKLLEQGPIVLFFYRGNWCPVCNRYLSSYQDSLKSITDQGVSVVAITPESIENVEQTVKLHKLSFTVIYDCQEQIMKNFDVMFNVTQTYQDKVKKNLSIDIAKSNGRPAAHLPVPATFIINRDGIIVAEQFDPDFHNRATVKWMLKNIGLVM